MTIQFPNESRSYDDQRRCVLFWGHDGAREVSFLVEEAALHKLGGRATSDEAALLSVFDSHRELISNVARKVYDRRGSGFYKLAASNF